MANRSSKYEEMFGLQPGELYGADEEAYTPLGVMRINGYRVEFTENEVTGLITAWVKGLGNVAYGSSLSEAKNEAKKRLTMLSQLIGEGVPKDNAIAEALGRERRRHRSVGASLAKGVKSNSVSATLAPGEGGGGLLYVYPLGKGGVFLSFKRHITLSPRFQAKDVQAAITKFGEGGLEKLLRRLGDPFNDIKPSKLEAFGGNDDYGIFFGAEAVVSVQKNKTDDLIDALRRRADPYGVNVSVMGEVHSPPIVYARSQVIARALTLAANGLENKSSVRSVKVSR